MRNPGKIAFSALLAATIAATPLTSAAATQAVQGEPITQMAAATAKAIETMIGLLDKASKSPAGQMVKLLGRGAMAAKLYRVSREVQGLKTDVAALDRNVVAILSDVIALNTRVEKGELLTAAEIAAANQRIDLHALHLAAVEREIEVLKIRMDNVEREQRALAQQQQATADKVGRHGKVITRDAKTPLLYFDPKTRQRIDIRKRDDVRGGLLDVKADQR